MAGHQPHVRTRVPLPRRLLLDRVAARWWTATLVLAALAWVSTAQAAGRAEAARRAWGERTTVLVADRGAQPGDPLAGAVRTERWPRALVPPDALRSLPRHAVAAIALPSGTPLVRASVSGGATPAAPEVALPPDDARLPVSVGDRVDVWATWDPTLVADGDPRTVRVAASARVRAAEDGRVVLAVRAREVRALVDAAASATVSLSGAVGDGGDGERATGAG